MTERDYATYRALYLTLADTLTPPDLVIYLRASVDTLIRRIALRNRDYERSISPDYLENLNSLYESWIQHFTSAPSSPYRQMI